MKFVHSRFVHMITSVVMFSLVLLCAAIYFAPTAMMVTAEKASQSTPTTAAHVAETTPEPEPEKQEVLALPAALDLQVNTGDTLVALLTDTGITPEEAQEAVAALRKIYDPKRLDIGQKVAVNLDPSQQNPTAPVLKRMAMPVSALTTLEVTRTPKGKFAARKINAPTFKKLVKIHAPIRSSFYETALSAGISVQSINQLIKIFSYDVDFQRDIKKGHTLTAVIERIETADGTLVSRGNTVYAALKMGKENVEAYRFGTEYFNRKGESLRKALLRTPINGARITSRFGMRQHPILGYSKMHRGVDFGAATGTPIYAAGDGTVAEAGRKGGYGNYVRIKHNGKYSTAYAHASRIAKGIRPGARVKQGQVIAYVGSTGASTGPHLHYEILANGVQVNPSSTKFKTGTVLAGAELKRFKAQVGQVSLALGEAKPKAVAEAKPAKKAKQVASN